MSIDSGAGNPTGSDHDTKDGKTVLTPGGDTVPHDAPTGPLEAVAAITTEGDVQTTLTTPEDPSTITPEGTVAWAPAGTVAELPEAHQNIPRKGNRLRRAIATLAGASVLGVSGYFIIGRSSSDTTATPARTPSASASPNPGSASPETSASQSPTTPENKEVLYPALAQRLEQIRALDLGSPDAETRLAKLFVIDKDLIADADPAVAFEHARAAYTELTAETLRLVTRVQPVAGFSKTEREQALTAVQTLYNPAFTALNGVAPNVPDEQSFPMELAWRHITAARLKDQSGVRLSDKENLRVLASYTSTANGLRLVLTVVGNNIKPDLDQSFRLPLDGNLSTSNRQARERFDWTAALGASARTGNIVMSPKGTDETITRTLLSDDELAALAAR